MAQMTAHLATRAQDCLFLPHDSGASGQRYLCVELAPGHLVDQGCDQGERVFVAEVLMHGASPAHWPVLGGPCSLSHVRLEPLQQGIKNHLAARRVSQVFVHGEPGLQGQRKAAGQQVHQVAGHARPVRSPGTRQCRSPRGSVPVAPRRCRCARAKLSRFHSGKPLARRAQVQTRLFVKTNQRVLRQIGQRCGRAVFVQVSACARAAPVVHLRLCAGQSAAPVWAASCARQCRPRAAAGPARGWSAPAPPSGPG